MVGSAHEDPGRFIAAVRVTVCDDYPRSEGEDKATGNDLVSQKRGGMQQAMATRPDFNTLDTKNKGSLTAGDVMDADFAAGGPLAATEEKRWRGAIGDGSEEVSAALRTRADRASAASSDLQVTDSKSIRSKTPVT